MTGRNVGFALKLHQRAWALQRGVSEIAWTFDPLVSRNAYFNLVSWARSRPSTCTNFYGTMLDGINGGDDTDRLLVRWRLREPAVVAACAGGAAGAVADELACGATVGLGIGADGAPVPGRSTGDRRWSPCPATSSALRVADPALAARWRVAVREALAALLADGGRIVGFDRGGWYVVRRDR